MIGQTNITVSCTKTKSLKHEIIRSQICVFGYTGINTEIRNVPGPHLAHFLYDMGFVS